MGTIVIFGAGGRAGRPILTEARRRGHHMVAAVRNPDQHADLDMDGVTLVAADAAKPHEVRAAATGCDVAVSTAPAVGDIPTDHLAKINETLFEGLDQARVKRLLMIGGAGTLLVAPGKQFIDTPAFPDTAKPRGLAHREALRALHTETMPLEWVYITPPPGFFPDGECTGTYRVHHDQPVTEDLSTLSISYADYAIGFVDEIENPNHHNESILLTGPV